MTESSVRNTLTVFITDELLGGDSVNIDDNILRDGMIDSVGMMRLIAFMEEEFKFSVSPTDFVVENFESIEVMTKYVLDRVGAGDK